MTPYGDIDLFVNICSCNGLLPDGTKPLPEPMLNFRAPLVLQVKVVDSDGHVVPVGKFGELMTRGACVMLGYYGDDEKTSAVLGKDRWYKTG